MSKQSTTVRHECESDLEDDTDEEPASRSPFETHNPYWPHIHPRRGQGVQPRKTCMRCLKSLPLQSTGLCTACDKILTRKRKPGDKMVKGMTRGELLTLRIKKKCGSGELRQALKKADWDAEEIDFVVVAIKRWIENHEE